MMKTMYLHIGMPRTATTVLQTFCADNEEELNRNGYSYPIMPFSYKNANSFRTAHFMFGYVINSDGSRDREREKQYRREGFQRCYEVFEQYDNIILSDEGIWNCGFREEESVWDRLVKEMEEHNFVTKVIVYLRRQDEFLYSWWNQRIKEGKYAECTITWEDMRKKLPIVQLDYYDVLENIAAYVGRENIIVRRFDRNAFLGGSIVADFLDAVGLPFSDAYRVESETLNRGLTKNNAEIKRILNKLTWRQDSRQNLIFQHILAHNSNQKDDDRGVSMYSEDEAISFYETYRESNGRVAMEYLQEEGDLFDFTYTAQQKWSPNNEEMLEDLVLFMGNALIGIEKELQAQKQEIEYIKNRITHPLQAVIRKIKK